MRSSLRDGGTTARAAHVLSWCDGVGCTGQEEHLLLQIVSSLAAPVGGMGLVPKPTAGHEASATSRGHH